jgi:hypothetical protein
VSFPDCCISKQLHIAWALREVGFTTNLVHTFTFRWTRKQSYLTKYSSTFMLYFPCYIIDVSRVIYNTGFGLDDWIYWHLIHRTRDYSQYSAIADLCMHFTLHLCTRTRVVKPSLVVSRQRTYNSLTHQVFSSPPNSFLAIIQQLPIPKTRLNSISLLPISYPGRLASRNSTLHCRLLFCTAEHLFITTLHADHAKNTA